jgi:hypothetical protein
VEEALILKEERKHKLSLLITKTPCLILKWRVFKENNLGSHWRIRDGERRP